MSAKKLEPIKLLIAGLSIADRAMLLKDYGPPPPTEHNKPNGPRIYPRREAARLAGRSLRWIDSIARRGLVRRVKLPGSIRACGIRGDDLERLIESATVAAEGGVS